MAKREHVELLKRGVKEWNVWREQHRELPDLSGANLNRARLDQANLGQTDLREADLSGAKLNRAKFNHANLGKANLVGADLIRADLTAARLNQAILIQADLSESDLSAAKLNEADLREADMRWASLVATKLDGACFDGLLIGSTVFADVDLSVVKDLDGVRHLGPSTIGIDTLYRSGGNIPNVFLRGAGVTEIFINYIDALIGKPPGFYSCFISYSHVDNAFARRLSVELEGRGIHCWLDEHQLLPGDDIYEEVDRGIKLWDKVLLCCSRASLSSWWVDNEINKAFVKEQILMRERGTKLRALIPLDLDGGIFAWKDGKADEIRRRLAADFTSWEKNEREFERQIERVVRALRTDDGGREQPPKSRL